MKQGMSVSRETYLPVNTVFHFQVILICMNKKTISSPREIEAFIQAYPDWSFGGDALHATYALGSFEEAITAINAVAQICKELDHHPTIENTYNKLSFTMTTHDAGDKVTGIDIAVAKRITETMGNHR